MPGRVFYLSTLLFFPLGLLPPLTLGCRWWSVFWVLFTAKSSGNGTEEAMLYTQVRLALFHSKSFR